MTYTCSQKTRIYACIGHGVNLFNYFKNCLRTKLLKELWNSKNFMFVIFIVIGSQ